MIIKEIDANIKTRKLEDLCDVPCIVYVNKFTEESAKQFKEDMQKAEDSFQDIIPIVIDSYGGEVYSLLNMVDVIKSSKKKIATIGLGKMMSCGSFLLSFGTEGYRFCGSNSTIMIHDVSNHSFGKVEDVKTDAKETERLNELLYSFLDLNCKKVPGHFKNEVHHRSHADWYLTASEALSHNLVNKIGIPKFKVKVSLDFSMEL